MGAWMMRVGMSLIMFGALLLTSSCDALPRDPDKTLKIIDASRRIRVGLIADPNPLADLRDLAASNRAKN